MMISKMQFMDSLVGKPVVDALIHTLYNQMEDFPSIYTACWEVFPHSFSVL